MKASCLEHTKRGNMRHNTFKNIKQVLFCRHGRCSSYWHQMHTITGQSSPNFCTRDSQYLVLRRVVFKSQEEISELPAHALLEHQPIILSLLRAALWLLTPCKNVHYGAVWCLYGRIRVQSAVIYLDLSILQLKW